LQQKPEVTALKFGKHFTDHMLKILYHESLGGWQRPEILPFENIVLHPAAKVLHYATEVSSFVMDKVALGQVSSEYFGFPCQSSFHLH
jgi:hypothetical protein